MTSPSANVTDVVFDFCGVLIDWQTRACLEGRYPQVVVDRICADNDPCGFYDYEDRMDHGEDFEAIYPDVVREQGEEIAEIFRDYIERYGDALPRMIPDMEQLLRELGELLQGTVVSGVEKMHKPNADIYELALSRFNLRPESSVFFDDTAKNVTGAQAVGMHAFRFTNAGQARRDLKSLGMDF